MDWVRVVVVATYQAINFTYSGMDPTLPPPNSPNISIHTIVTFHASREDAIKKEIGIGTGTVTARSVYLIHDGKVEKLTWVPKKKMVTKVVEEPDGFEMKTEPVE